MNKTRINKTNVIFAICILLEMTNIYANRYDVNITKVNSANREITLEYYTNDEEKVALFEYDYAEENTEDFYNKQIKPIEALFDIRIEEDVIYVFYFNQKKDDKSEKDKSERLKEDKLKEDKLKEDKLYLMLEDDIYYFYYETMYK